MSKTFSITQALAVPSNVALLRKHNVFYVDRGLIAINKPSGLVTQGTIDPTRKVRTASVVEGSSEQMPPRKGLFKLLLMVGPSVCRLPADLETRQRYPTHFEHARRSIYGTSSG